ncbi:hypothetical protein [Janibacter hoylei]|uniref:hypothetical protein n=1 Tax=Janibacter hoylei TaxID=364298 RepID=UPI000FE35DD7|nr:hypothetical protein [Janibacter hoylei]
MSRICVPPVAGWSPVRVQHVSEIGRPTVRWDGGRMSSDTIVLAEDLSTDDLSGLLWPLYGALIANLQVLIDVVDDVATAEPVRT